MNQLEQNGEASGSLTHKQCAIHCKWDFCSETFLSFSEWQTHFTVEHIAYAQPIDLTGRNLRKRKEFGQWEVIDPSPRPANGLPINPHPSQTTGDITTSTHTLSFPVPPSFQSLPDPPASGAIPSDYHLSFHKHDERGIQDHENDVRLYQSFLRSPSPELGQSGSGSGSIQLPPPGQRSKTPPWTPSQPSVSSQRGPNSASGSKPSNPSTHPPASISDFNSPFRTSQSISSQVSPDQQTINPTGLPATQGAIPLRFGAALGKGEGTSPFKESPTAQGRTVGFNWGGSS
ncbi:uncharacterized protein L199_007723 [Kwoniella botswanensis]|uniref:uncharacterized protein n=1 Tax=Kwoniella botswanensis TaxID=1268659 RepID=UPI00315D3E44